MLGTTKGVLAQELMDNPIVILRPIRKLLSSAIGLSVQQYKNSFVPLLLFVVRLTLSTLSVCYVVTSERALKEKKQSRLLEQRDGSANPGEETPLAIVDVRGLIFSLRFNRVQDIERLLDSIRALLATWVELTTNDKDVRRSILFSYYLACISSLQIERGRQLGRKDLTTDVTRFLMYNSYVVGWMSNVDI